MSRIIVIGDLHFGMRRNSKTFHDILMKSLTWALNTIKKSDSVVIVGDVFDSRSTVDFKILNDAWDFFITLSRSCKELYVLAGNHDEYYKEFSRENTNCRFLEFEPGSDSKIAPVKVVTELSEIKIAGNNCLFIPWIDHIDKKNAAKKALEGSIDVLFGHFDSVGLYHNNDPLALPLSFTSEDFKGIPLVLSGHYHKRIENGNIKYVGSFINSTFNDLDDIKGLYTIGKDRKLEFKPNGCPTFHYLTIDNPAMFVKAVETADAKQIETIRTKVEGNFIKIFLQEYRKENDEVYKILKAMNPIDIFVAFNRTEFNDETPIDFEGFDSKTDIAQFLVQYVDGIKDKLPA
jgi:DNA repair exonuclease SbcCD nuclease subunit